MRPSGLPTTLLALSGACSAPPSAPAPPEPVDRVIEGRALPSEDRAQVWIHQGRILRLAPAGTPAPVEVERVAAFSAGIVDAHAHPDGVGDLLAELDLTDATSYAEVLRRVAAAPPGPGWLTGRGWDQNRWADLPPGGWPLAADLERAAPGRKVALRRVDGHAVWMSAAALATPLLPEVDPPGGRVIRGADGGATGVLVDAAMALVPVPPLPDEVRRARLLAGLEHLRQGGLVGVHAMGLDDAELSWLAAFQRDRTLPLRVTVYVDPGTEAEAALLAEGPRQLGERLQVVGVKRYLDGALGSRGALLSAPYLDAPEQTGLALASVEEVEGWARALNASGAQLAVHAIGDAAVERALSAAERSGVRGLRVEHAQVVRPELWPRLAQAGLIASMQPRHAPSDLPWAAARLGPERLAWTYRWRDALHHGVPLVLGSDAPVEPADAGETLGAALRRWRGPGDPPPGWGPDQALTLTEALQGLTTAPYRALGQDGGALVPGAPADLTLWEEGPDGLRALGAILDGR